MSFPVQGLGLGLHTLSLSWWWGLKKGQLGTCSKVTREAWCHLCKILMAPRSGPFTSSGSRFHSIHSKRFQAWVSFFEVSGFEFRVFGVAGFGVRGFQVMWSRGCRFRALGVSGHGVAGLTVPGFGGFESPSCKVAGFGVVFFEYEFFSSYPGFVLRR